MTRILVTGGAGYVGSVSVEAFLAAGHEVVVLDDLTTGHRAAVPAGATLHVGHVRRQDGRRPASSRPSGSRRSSTARRGRWSASRSRDPSRYYRDNVAGGIALLEAARATGVGRIVFSSTAAVYGVPDATPIPEDAPLRPINPYGESKRTFEGALAWYGRAYGLRSVSLRYFNVAGATEALGEDHDPETHLIPNVLAAAEGGDRADRLRRRLPDPRRHLHPRLHPRRRPRRRPPPGDRGDRARRPADRRAARLQPRQRRRVLDPRGHRRRRARGRGGHPVHGRAASGRRPAGPRRSVDARRGGPRLAPGPTRPRRDGRVRLGLAPGPPGRLPGLSGSSGPTASPRSGARDAPHVAPSSCESPSASVVATATILSNLGHGRACHRGSMSAMPIGRAACAVPARDRRQRGSSGTPAGDSRSGGATGPIPAAAASRPTRPSRRAPARSATAR